MMSPSHFFHSIIDCIFINFNFQILFSPDMKKIITLNVSGDTVYDMSSLEVWLRILCIENDTWNYVLIQIYSVV